MQSVQAVCAPCSCLIPDIYRGKVGVNKEEASHLLSKLDWAQAVQDIKQAVQYLRDDGATKASGTRTKAAVAHITRFGTFRWYSSSTSHVTVQSG
jgi:hypothetical protein